MVRQRAASTGRAMPLDEAEQEKSRVQRCIAKLLCVLRMMSAANRRARFRCAIALCQADELLHIVEADAQGHIAEGPRGANGFGYDPVFVPEGFSQTFAELTPDLKNQISHRAKAVAELLRWLPRAGSAGVPTPSTRSERPDGGTTAG